MLTLLDCWLLSNLGKLKCHPGREPSCICVYYHFADAAQPGADISDKPHQPHHRQVGIICPFLMGLTWSVAVKDWLAFRNMKYFFFLLYKADILIVLENSGSNYLISFLILNNRFQQPPVAKDSTADYIVCVEVLSFYLLWNTSLFLNRDVHRLGVFPSSLLCLLLSALFLK